MNCKTAHRLNIVIAIIFAIGMLLSAYILVDKEISDKVNLFLITVWLIPFFYFSRKSHNKNDE